MKRTIQLTVNGQAVAAEVEPRLQLADFLREHLLLTGTHLGCEHGVCGACTIEIDGAPARSCIAYAVACEGADVRTIEGFETDRVMAELREAFSVEHALQCGYCTPGMLVTARDIVLRLPDADEARIRKELAGNLCRCTGYVGIVRAIQSVLAKRSGQVPARSSAARAAFDSTIAFPSVHPERNEVESKEGSPRPRQPARVEAKDEPPRRPARVESKDERTASITPQASLHQSFTVAHPRDKVWDFFGHLDQVTLCLPGASVIGTPSEDRVDMKLRVKLGPIAAEFEGSAEVSRDPPTYSGVIHGSARDARSSSMTRGQIHYALSEESSGTTRVDVDVAYRLTGALAQFSRSAIVQDITRRMTAAFARNLEARLSQEGSGPGAAPAPETRTAEFDAGSLLFSAVWQRVKAFFRSLTAR